jgi:Flp pilus assembly protein TadG
MIGRLTPARWRRGLAALGGEQRGVALIEFAMVIPFLLALFVGGYQISDAVAAYRKVTSASRTVADLTTQYTQVSNSDLDTILNASQQVMSPYPVANAQLTVSQIKVDAARNATVDWSRGKNATALIKDSAYVLPDEIRQANTSLIVARIMYTYRPTVFGTLLGTIPLTETIIMSPRASSTINKV